MPEIDATTADAVRQLRHTVLYPERPLDECGYPGDALESTCHLGASEGGRLAGVLSLFNEPPADEGGTPGEAGGTDWRIRGTAVLPEYQGAGVGSALVKEARRRVRNEGGRRVWCYARVSAVGFYERLGFVQQYEVQLTWTDRRMGLMDRSV